MADEYELDVTLEATVSYCKRDICRCKKAKCTAGGFATATSSTENCGVSSRDA